jgi:hypothetical protein
MRIDRNVSHVMSLAAVTLRQMLDASERSGLIKIAQPRKLMKYSFGTFESPHDEPSWFE